VYQQGLFGHRPQKASKQRGKNNISQLIKQQAAICLLASIKDKPFKSSPSVEDSLDLLCCCCRCCCDAVDPDRACYY